MISFHSVPADRLSLNLLHQIRYRYVTEPWDDPKIVTSADHLLFRSFACTWVRGLFSICRRTNKKCIITNNKSKTLFVIYLKITCHCYLIDWWLVTLIGLVINFVVGSFALATTDRDGSSRSTCHWLTNSPTFTDRFLFITTCTKTFYRLYLYTWKIENERID